MSSDQNPNYDVCGGVDPEVGFFEAGSDVVERAGGKAGRPLQTQDDITANLGLAEVVFLVDS